ncbi:MAG: bifunctional acetate--CoA ligase family protein/GNAT family N-acetyltransferase [Candidatus Bathyarchaeia archaeon]|nr:bifunctional acetate--CoA ligase family protein/GNAT family N-acetyltransferase [Candidatus Bathyarchaeota archaeon]
MGKLENMFNPKAVAFIGATEREGSIGQQIMKNLLLGKDKRAIYPINPNREFVMGLKCLPSVIDAPEHIDLAVIATPAKTIPKIIDECGQKGVDGVVIISAGFREAGVEGAELEKEVKKIQEKYDIRILGPNCLGFIRPHIALNAAFSRVTPEPGEIAFISQSAALGSAMLDWAVSAKIGFSMFASLGLMLDIDFGDLINYLGEDPYTRSIIIYMESIGSAKKFVSAARSFARTKPIIILKSGKYTATAKAVQSHTGALAGSFEVYDAVFKRLGLLRVDEIEDLFNCASVLSSRNLPEGAKIAVITNAGGPGVMASDAIINYGGELAELSKESINALEKILPHYWSRGNPIDVMEEANAERYEKVLNICLSDPNVDGVIVIYTPQGAAQSTELAKKIIEAAKKKIKPILTVWMGGNEAEEARKLFYINGVPTYPTPEKAVKTYMYMYRYKRNLELLYETPEELPIDVSPPKNHLKLIIKKAIKEGRFILNQNEADKFLDAYRIPKIEAYFVKNEEEAVKAALKIGYPIVIKAISPKIIHKSDVNGVILNIESENELRDAYKKLYEEMKSSGISLDGVYIQKMIKEIDYELILGAKKDKDFGAIIIFGQGGRNVEFIKDFAIGLPPLNQTLAKRMMEETRIYQVLIKGLRRKTPVNIRNLEEIVVQFSNLIIDFPEIMEIEINPLAVSGNNIYALDSRIIIDRGFIEDSNPYPHLVILPYPTKYVTPWKLKNGTEVILRPIRPEDEKLELEFIKSLSRETCRFRFFRVLKDVSHLDLVKFCNIDYDREIAIIAELNDKGRKREIGAARLIVEPNGKKGEVAIVVADEFQKKGLGTKLMDVIIGIAEEKNLETIYGIIMPENEAIIQLCRKMGFTISRINNEVIATLNLKS